MKEANTYGQPIASVVDLFIAVCTASGECNPLNPLGISFGQHTFGSPLMRLFFGVMDRSDEVDPDCETAGAAS